MCRRKLHSLMGNSATGDSLSLAVGSPVSKRVPSAGEDGAENLHDMLVGDDLDLPLQAVSGSSRRLFATRPGRHGERAAPLLQAAAASHGMNEMCNSKRVGDHDSRGALPSRMCTAATRRTVMMQRRKRKREQEQNRDSSSPDVISS